MAGILQKFLHLRLWVAVCVGALTKFCDSLFSPTSVPWWSPAVRLVMSATLAIYQLDALLDEPDAGRGPGGRRMVWVFFLASAAWFAFELLHASARVFWLVLLGCVPCLLYAVRLGGVGRVHQLKAIPWLKAPFVGGAVGLAVVYVPVLAHVARGSPVTSPTLFLSASLMCFCTANANLFDVPDERRDRAAHVPTAPVLLGYRGARLLGVGWTILGMLCALLTLQVRRYPLLGLGVALLFAHALVRPETKKASLALWVDGCLMLPLIIRTILS